MGPSLSKRAPGCYLVSCVKDQMRFLKIPQPIPATPPELSPDG